MFATNTYSIRPATADDRDALRKLAERNSAAPLTGTVLIGEARDGSVAAISLHNGHAVADPAAAYLASNLRIRAMAASSEAAEPSLRERMLAGLPAWYHAVSTPVSAPSPASDAELAHAG
jgi:hypothetical protein